MKIRIHTCSALTLFMAMSAGASSDFPIPFSEEAQARGILYLATIGDFNNNQFGVGMSLSDLDGDGDPDLLCGGAADGEVALFENDGSGNFTKKMGSGIANITALSGLTTADYDGDGDLDIHMTMWLEDDRLYRNMGDLTFEDVTLDAGLSGTDGAGNGAAWNDYDGDGDIDLYVSNYTCEQEDCAPNRLWNNQGDGTFIDVAPDLGLDDQYLTMQAIWLDYDLDGDSDLYLSTDRGSNFGTGSNRLFRNDGGAFTEVSEASGTDVRIDSMGVGLGDVDGDGLLDLYCTNLNGTQNQGEGNPLLLNNGDGTFTDQSATAGTLSFSTGWAAHFFDFDNDCDKDLYVCNIGYGANNPSGLNNFYRNESGFPMTDIAPFTLTTAFGESFTMATGDVDLDGDLDMFVQNTGMTLKLFINHEGNLRRSVSFDVRGVDKNRFAIGSRLEATSGTNFMVQEISSGSDFKCTNDFIQHFGLGEATSLDVITITFPDGSTRTLQDAPSDQVWKLWHQDLLGDVDGDGLKGPLDLNAFPSAQASSAFEHGHEVLDLDGNFVIDADDIDAFLLVYQGPIEDCDSNGMVDARQIALGIAPDLDQDGRIDDCTAPCLGDFNLDGVVNGADLSQLLASWQLKGQSATDLDGDGIVSGSDLAIILGVWGPC